MVYRLNDEFTKIEETEGVLENKSIHSRIEIVVTDVDPEKDTGIEVQPKEKMPFCVKEGKFLYARSTNMDHMGANLAVVNFNMPASGKAGAGDLIDDNVTVADKTWSSQKIEEKLNAVNGKDGIGIRDITYNISTNTLDVELTDGSKKSFGDIGAKLYGGLDMEALFVGNVTAGKTYTFSKDMINFDFLLISGSRRARLSAYQQTCQYIIPKDR